LHCIGGPVHLPNGFTGVFVHGKQVGRIVRLHAMEYLDIKTFAVQQRRGSITVIETETSIVGLDIPLPNFLAVHRETGQFPIPGHDPNVLTIGDGRRRG
jgi:hypothetical protein